MAEKRKVSNLLALAVLSYLTQGPMHPYELGRTLRDSLDVGVGLTKPMSGGRDTV